MITRIPDMLFGADYNPEQWDAETISQDIALMVEAGVNIVTLPVFSWSRIEPEFNSFDFQWLDDVIEKLWEANISIDLATATATPPAWLVREHPEMLPVNRDGIRLEFGSRQSYCPSSLIWREHCARMATKMVERYAEHPAIVMWHVSNEYGDHISRCYCEESSRDFRKWLQSRYQTVDALNRAWGTTSWGQIYSSFDQIKAPTIAPGPINPSQTLDFDRFSSDALLELFRVEVDVIRSHNSSTPITTNFMSFFKDLDYWTFADLEDVVSDDAYPDPSDPNAYLDAALNYSLMRSLKNQPWLLLEQAPSAVSWRELNAPKPPGTMRLFSMQAIAHGSDGVMYFQWRAGRFGTEKFHSAILGHRGTQSRTWRECSALGNELKNLSELVGTKVSTPIAMLADWNSRWALGTPEAMPSEAFNWMDLAKSWNSALASQGLQVDIVRPQTDMIAYKVLLVPNAYLIDSITSEFLKSFVSAGGIAVVGPFSGVVDENDHVHFGGAPGPISELLGISVDEWWPIVDGQHELVELDGLQFNVSRWSEWVELGTATNLGIYISGHLKGKPSVTTNKFGKGIAIYVSADVDANGLDAIFRHVVKAANIQSLCDRVPSGLDMTIRSDGKQDYLIAVNFSDVPSQLPTWVTGLELCTQQHLGENSHVGAQDVVIVKLENNHQWS